MKIYTVTIDGRPEKQTYTMIITLVREYKLNHRKTLTGLKLSGKYQEVVDGKYFMVMETELKKCKRKVNPKKEHINHY